MNHVKTQDNLSPTKFSKRLNRDMQLSQVRNYLRAGKLIEAEQALQMIDWHDFTVNVKKKSLASLWEIVTERTLSTEIKQWLEKQMPLVESIGQLIIGERWFEQLNIHNHDLLDELSRKIQFPFEHAFNALLASVKMDKGQAVVPLWNRLSKIAGLTVYDKAPTMVRVREAKTMARVLKEALTGENEESMHWALTYNPYLQQDQLLVSGLQELGQANLTQEKLQRLLGMVDYNMINWDQLQHSLSPKEMVIQVKAKMERARLEQTIEGAGGKQLNKAHL